jgi:SMODS-associating 2TM, beta-strand rich effector domain
VAHAYSVDSAERRRLPLFFALLAVLAAIGVSRLLSCIGARPPEWISAPDALAFYGVFYLVFDRFIWRWAWVRNLGISKIPNISGEWRGQVASANNDAPGFGTPKDITLSIRQSWTEILVKAETTQSISCSLSAHMLVADGYVLGYEYLNEPRAGAPDTMHAHRGSTRLSFDGKDSLVGEYYTGRDRKNFGTLSLKRT